MDHVRVFFTLSVSSFGCWLLLLLLSSALVFSPFVLLSSLVIFDINARTYRRIVLDYRTYIVTEHYIDNAGRLVALSPGLVYGNNTWTLVEYDLATGTMRLHVLCLGLRPCCSCLFVAVCVCVSVMGRSAVSCGARPTPSLPTMAALYISLCVRRASVPPLPLAGQIRRLC